MFHFLRRLKVFHRVPLLIFASILASTSFAQFEPKTTVGGYGELHYNEPDGHRRGMLDFHRFVIYISHNFSEKIAFHSEIELEHTLVDPGKGGELSIEQAFLDYRIVPSFGVRVGILLPPVGLINLYHEPPTFNGVERPSVDRVIIPTTWRESGIGIYGSPAEQVQYQIYVVGGLKAEGFSASDGLRGGRQKGLESNPANPSITGRLDYTPALGLQLGGSFFAGGAASDKDSIGEPTVALWSGDIRYRIDEFSFRAVGAIATISDADKLNAKVKKSVADRIFGYYIEGAYNFLPLLCSESEQELNVFAR
ncbi:MAG: porin, partial [Bacteroidota bacterium]